MDVYRLLVYELYAFVFFVPLLPYRTKLSIFPISADTVIGALFIFTCAVYLFTGKRYKKLKKIAFSDLKHDLLFISLLVYMGVLFLSLVFAKSKSVGIAEILRFAEYPFFFYFIIYAIKDKDVLRKVFSIFSYSLIIALVCGVLQVVLINFPVGQKIVQKIFYSEGQFYGVRAYSTFVNPNYWGAFLNLILFIYIFRLKQAKDIERKICWLIISLGLVNLVLTFTMGSWISFIIVSAALLARRRKKLIILAALLLLMVVVVLALIPPTRQAVLSLIKLKTWTGNERIRLWITGLLMFKDHPVIGVGSGNYLVRYIDYIKAYPYLYLGRDAYSVHNSYIKVMAETGLLGITAFLFVLVNLIRKFTVLYRESSGSFKNIKIGVLAGASTFIIQNFLNNLFFIPQVNVFFWTMIALAIVYRRIINDPIGMNAGL
jgi:Lipid A core - O-antigen ligase and related enzymes